MPWTFGPTAEAIARRFLNLRYRLLPYFYNAFYQETQTGLPIMRPLFLNDPADELVAGDDRWPNPRFVATPEHRRA